MEIPMTSPPLGLCDHLQRPAGLYLIPMDLHSLLPLDADTPLPAREVAAAALWDVNRDPPYHHRLSSAVRADLRPQ
jgi:hypothetical protein